MKKTASFIVLVAMAGLACAGEIENAAVSLNLAEFDISAARRIAVSAPLPEKVVPAQAKSKGEFSTVNQESINAKVKSYEEKYGARAYALRVVEGVTLEIYTMRKLVTHGAIRVKTDPASFYQLELQSLGDLAKAGIIGYRRAGAVVKMPALMGDQGDLVEFPDSNERQKLDKLEPHYATMPVCTDNKAARESVQWYKDCLGRYVGSYSPENASASGQAPKVYNYNLMNHNCFNFAEEALEACGLAHCFNLGKSSGFNKRTGVLE